MPTSKVGQPDPIATPEGDNENAPETPLTPAAQVGLEVPPGNAPSPYEADEKPKSKHKPEGIEKFIDEVVRGEYM